MLFRSALERAWGPGGRLGEDDLPALLAGEPVERATLAQALHELPRMLDRSRRRSGALRTLEGLATLEKAAAPAEPVTPGNGVAPHARED